MQISEKNITDTVNAIVQQFRRSCAQCRNPLTINAYFRDAHSKLSGIRLLFPTGKIHHRIAQGLNELAYIRDEFFDLIKFSSVALELEHKLLLSNICDLGSPLVPSFSVIGQG